MLLLEQNKKKRVKKKTAQAFLYTATYLVIEL